MADDFDSPDGRVLGEDNSVTFTPEILLWLNSKKGRKDYRITFFNKISNLIEDIQSFGMPKRANAKVIRSVEVPVFYIRLSKSVRILFDYSTHGNKIEIMVLCVSDKKEFQDKLKRSAEHIVHASSFDRLDWDDENTEELDLSKCNRSDIIALQKKASIRFGKLPEKEQQEGWTKEDYVARAKRATIYDFVIPNVMDYGVLKENDDFELPAILKLQEHQKELMNYENNQFLLEGVAGTGKTTILIYRFVNDIKNSRNENTKPEKEILFVTHNERLKKDIVQSLKLFFPKEEHERVSKCIKTVKELFMSYVKNVESFAEKKELNRRRFRTLFDRNDVDLDLFWEEYRGVLRGYNLVGSEYIITPTMYSEIGRRRGRIAKTQREDFYKMATEAIQRSSGSSSLQNTWDSLDLCRSIFTNIMEHEELRTVQCLYIDEVQDLTRAEMEVLLTLLKPNGLRRFAVAGDLSQSIQPSSFTWQALSDLVYDVLQLRISKHQTLVENFRSTPHLVEAANYILSLQGVLDNEGTPSLQRPFAGENTGEPGLVFFDDELDLIDFLNHNHLPNAGAPMLVRDETTKQYLSTLIRNKSFLITIAQFKGLERRNMLLWAPDSGSEGILNLRADPVRGPKAREREFSNSTALLELRHVFVAFTRARYLMGILSPQNDKSYFMKELIENTSSVSEAGSEKLELFSEELSEEALLEYANEYMNAELYEMAAEAYRNLRDEHNYHFCQGQYAIEEQRFDDAVHHLYKAAVEKTGENSEFAGELITENTDRALDSTEKRPTTLAKILAGAKNLPAKTRYRLEAEREEERDNWLKAAKNYIQSGNVDRAKFCVQRVKQKDKQTVLFIDCNAMKEASKSFKSFVGEKLDRTKAVKLALAKPEVVKSILSGRLKPLRAEFQTPDIQWAKELAKNDRNLTDLISKEVQSKTLARVNTSRAQELEVLSLLKNTKNHAVLRKRVESESWKFIPNEAYIELKIIDNDLVDALSHAMDLKSPKDRDSYLRKICKSGKNKNEMLNLYYLLKNHKQSIGVNLEAPSDYTLTCMKVSLVAEAAWKDSTEIPDLIVKLQHIVDRSGKLATFAARWSSALLNYLIRQEDVKVSDELYYPLILRQALHTHEIKLNDMVTPMLLIMFKPKLLESDMIQSLASGLAKKMKPEYRTAMWIYMIFGEKYLPSKRPKFTARWQDEIEDLRVLINQNGTVELEKESIQAMKEIRKRAKSSKLMLIEYDDMKFKHIKPKNLRMVFMQAEIQFLLGVNASEGKTIPVANKTQESNVSQAQGSGYDEGVEKQKPEFHSQNETNSPGGEQKEQTLLGPKTEESKEKIDETIDEDFDASVFDIDYEGDTVSLYPKNFWNDLREQESNTHIETIQAFIKNGEVSDPIQYRTHILSYLDETLPPNENGLEVHLKFAIVLAVDTIARKLSEKSGILNVIPDSSLELIRLFKDSNKNQILESGTAYSLRVL